MKSISTDRGHFVMTFKNGYTVSIYNGFGSYTENKYDMKLIDGDDKCQIESNYGEIAILKDNMFVTKDILNSADDVIGYLNIDEIMDILKYVSEL